MLGKCEGLQWMEVEPERGEFVLANNGWVMNNPLIDFASEDSQVCWSWPFWPRFLLFLFLLFP